MSCSKATNPHSAGSRSLRAHQTTPHTAWPLLNWLDQYTHRSLTSEPSRTRNKQQGVHIVGNHPQRMLYARLKHLDTPGLPKIPSHPHTFRSTFRPGTVVTTPTVTHPDVFLSPRKNRFFSTLSSKIDEDGRENCVVRELFPNIDPIWRARVNGKWEHPYTVKGQTYRLDPDMSHVEEFANSLTQVDCQWVEVFNEFDTTHHTLPPLHKPTLLSTSTLPTSGLPLNYAYQHPRGYRTI